MAKKLTLTFIPMRTSLILACCLVVGHSALSQSKEIASRDSAYSYLSASLDFVNNYVYVGRPSRTTFPYLTPALTWYHKSGAYFGASTSILTKSSNTQVDLSYLTAGYMRSFGNFEGGVELNKYWYNKNSSNPKSEVNSDITISGVYAAGPVNIGASAFAMFSKKNTDWGTTLSVDHSFYLLEESLEIAPTLTMNAGTSKFYGKNFLRKFTPPNQNGITYDVTADLSDASRFKILDYELSIPVSYYFNKFTFSFTPTWAFPVNPATAVIQVTPSTGVPSRPRQVTETLNNVFFFALDLTYDF